MFLVLKNTKHFVQVLKALHILMDIDEDTILQSWASLWGIRIWAVCLWLPPLPSQWNFKRWTRGGLGEAGVCGYAMKGPTHVVIHGPVFMSTIPCTQVVGLCLSLWRHSKRIPFKRLGTKSSLQVPCHSCLSKPFGKYTQISCLARQRGWKVARHLMCAPYYLSNRGRN